MRGGIVLIVIGLLLGFMAVSGKLCCLNNLWGCATSNAKNPCECASKQSSSGTESSQKIPTVFEQLQQLLKDWKIY